VVLVRKDRGAWPFPALASGEEQEREPSLRAHAQERHADDLKFCAAKNDNNRGEDHGGGQSK
jgi:hypothetical protein